MENNMDIIVLTSVIIVLFIVFLIATVREVNTVSSKEFVQKEEGGPRAEMMRFIGKLFTDDRIEPGKKITFMNAVKTIIEQLPEDEIKKE